MAIGTSDGEHFPSQLEEVLSKLDSPMSKAPRNLGTDIKRDLNEDDVFPNGVPVLPNRNNEGVIDESPSSLNDQSKWFLRVEDDSLPANAKPTAAEFDKTTYQKVVDFLDNASNMKGSENWSAKELLGYALNQGMNALGFNNSAGGVTPPRIKYGGGGPKVGFSEVEFPKEYWVANDNSLNIYDRMKSFTEQLKNKPASGREGAPTIGEMLDGLKNASEPQTPYDKAVVAQQADKVIQSLRKDIKLITENPPQEPQGRPIPGEQARTQEAQRAANDRNYAMGKGSDRVNVGPGKGVLNDNKEEVSALIRKGSTPSEIARKFDITPMAVRNWIKRNGPITNIDDIPKK
jgi:DNA-binding CsgD family transcriptional regulator